MNEIYKYMPLYYREYSDKILLCADCKILSSELQLTVSSKDDSLVKL